MTTPMKELEAFLTKDVQLKFLEEFAVADYRTSFPAGGIEHFLPQGDLQEVLSFSIKSEKVKNTTYKGICFRYGGEWIVGLAGTPESYVGCKPLRSFMENEGTKILKDGLAVEVSFDGKDFTHQQQKIISVEWKGRAGSMVPSIKVADNMTSMVKPKKHQP